VVKATPRLFYLRNDLVPTAEGVGWVSGRSEQVREISLPAEFESQTVQHVASRYTDYAIPVIQDGTFAFFTSLSGIQIASMWQHTRVIQKVKTVSL